MQLAYGWATLAFYSNTLALLALSPLIYYMATHYGPIGAASVWAVLNCGYILFQLPIMHRRLLKGELRYWYLQDVGLPLLAVVGVAGIGRILIPAVMPWLETAMSLAIIFGVALLAATMAAPLVRVWVFNRLGRLRLADGA
jgi:hypothetical protein